MEAAIILAVDDTRSELFLLQMCGLLQFSASRYNHYYKTRVKVFLFGTYVSIRTVFAQVLYLTGRLTFFSTPYVPTGDILFHSVAHAFLCNFLNLQYFPCLASLLLYQDVNNINKYGKAGDRQMKVEYINPFINATRELMKIMVGIEEFKKRELTLNQQMRTAFDISAGNAYAELQKNGMGNFDRSLPSVIVGKGHVIKHPRNTPCINIVFDTELGSFGVQVSLKHN